MEVLPVCKDKDMLCFLMVATDTGHIETRTACFWRITMTCFPLELLADLTGASCWPLDDIQEAPGSSSLLLFIHTPNGR